MKERKDLQSAVTVLAYHFWGRDGYDEAFAKLKHAFCGYMFMAEHFSLANLKKSVEGFLDGVEPKKEIETNGVCN